jgi:hypothetical protein
MEASAATTSPEPRPKLSHSPMPRSPASSAAAKLAEARFHARYRPAGTVVVADYTVETDSDDLTTDAAVDSGRAIPAPATRHPRPSSSWRNVSGCASDAPPRVSHGVLPLRGCSWIFATQKKSFGRRTPACLTHLPILFFCVYSGASSRSRWTSTARSWSLPVRGARRTTTRTWERAFLAAIAPCMPASCVACRRRLGRQPRTTTLSPVALTTVFRPPNKCARSAG